MAGVNFTVRADEPGWSQNAVLPPLTRGSNPGTITGLSVAGIVAGQLNFPVPVEPSADPSNPIAVWEAVWSTAEFTPRIVRLRTITVRFDVYPDRNSPSSSSRLSGLTEGTAELMVSPAPGAAGVLVAAGAFAAVRRRKSTHEGTTVSIVEENDTGASRCMKSEWITYAGRQRHP